MPSIWEATHDIKKSLLAIRDQHHPHLIAASFWLLVTDAGHLSGNRVRYWRSAVTSKEERLATQMDFKVTLYAGSWSEATDRQREIILDEALSGCGVKYVPQTVEVNGRKEVVKDDLGRIVYTDQIDYDLEGRPKWCRMAHDAAIFFGMVRRHGDYCDELENLQRARDGKPLKGPAAPLFDALEKTAEFVESEGLESITMSCGDESVTIDRAAAKRIRKNIDTIMSKAS